MLLLLHSFKATYQPQSQQFALIILYDYSYWGPEELCLIPFLKGSCLPCITAVRFRGLILGGKSAINSCTRVILQTKALKGKDQALVSSAEAVVFNDSRAKRKSFCKWCWNTTHLLWRKGTSTLLHTVLKAILNWIIVISIKTKNKV